MKKCYTLLLLSLASFSYCFSQTRYWVAPSGGLWSSSANWSATSGGAGGASVPNSNSFDVVFDQNSLVNLDVPGLILHSIKVTNSITATVYSVAGNSIAVTSSTIGNEGVVIDAGSTLIDSTSGGNDFPFDFAMGSRGEINGSWQFGGDAAFPGNAAYFTAFNGGGTIVNFNTGSSLVCRNGGGADGFANAIFFKTGSLVWFNQDGGATPNGTYDANSTIRINGNINAATNISGSPADVGNIEYNCPGLTAAAVSMGLVNANIKGYFKIQNTNNKILVLTNNPTGTPTTTVGGNLEISGTSSVTMANNGNASNFQVNGDFVQSGGLFSLQNFSTTSTVTKFLLKGNFTQTGGTFTASSIATSNSSDLYIVELNGTSAQTISASSGTIDNAGNQVALSLNNSNNVTLNSPLAVGRMNFIVGKLITTGTNLLTINNTANNAIDINGVSASSYIDGPIKRKTANTTAYRFPVGKAGKYRFCEVLPSTAVASEYTAEYFDAGYSDLSVLTPLTGVSNNQYWDIAKVTGSDAQIRLTLNGAVPGAQPADAIVVAHYNGADWANARGATGNFITPGNSTSGSVTSGLMASFSPFTFGFLPASTLPIKMEYFTAVKGAGFNSLQWKADCTSSQATFEIERSVDARNFNKIQTIVADQLRCLQPFDYKDMNAGQGTVYYRLHVVDVNGTAYYSRVVAIIGKSSGFDIVGIYPTLVTTGQVKVNVAAGNSSQVEFNITNSNGQLVKKLKYNLTAGENIITVSVGELAAGVYQLTGYNSEGQVKTFRFIKQ